MTLADLTSPTFTGADLSTRVNAVLLEARGGRRFVDVAAVLSDTGMGYAGGRRPVAAGDRVVTADGFAYEVAAADASDNHLTTAGGVRLYVRARHGVATPRQFGAAVDGAADDTAAVQACADYCARTGHEFRLNRGATRVTGTIRFGLPVYSSWAGVLSRTDLYDHTPVYSLANRNLNRDTYRGCAISGESGAALVADLSPAQPTPVVEVNFHEDSGQSVIRDLVIAAPAYVDAQGQVRQAMVSTTLRQANLIGLAVAHPSAAEISGCKFVGMGSAGLATHYGFWQHVSNCLAWSCGVGFSLSTANASTTTRLVAWYCGLGAHLDGDACDFQIDTQDCDESVWFMAGDVSTLRTGYLEDTRATDGTGLYAVKTGTASGTASKLVHCTFLGPRVNGPRPNKRAFRLWGLSNCTFLGARERGQGVDADGVSRALLVNTDFADTAQLPLSRFGRVTGGRFNGPLNFGEDSGLIVQKRLIRVASFNYGTINAGSWLNKDITIADVGEAITGHAAVQVTQVSGGSSLVVPRGILLSATSLRLVFGNPGAAAISNYTATLDVEITLGSAAQTVTPS